MVDTDGKDGHPGDLLRKQRQRRHQEHTDWEVSEYYCKLLNGKENRSLLHSIPILTRKGVEQGIYKPGSLVRYRGMIQDVFDPEYFVGVSPGVHKKTLKERKFPTKYMDTVLLPSDYDIVEDAEDHFSSTMSRLPLFVVPTPGESRWAQKQFNDKIASLIPHRILMLSKVMVLVESERSMNQSTKQDWRSTTVRREMIPTRKIRYRKKGQKVVPRRIHWSLIRLKVILRKKREKLCWNTTIFFPIPLPDGDSESVPCLVKIYDCDGNSTSEFKVNTLMEFIGVYSVDPVLNTLPSSSSSLIEDRNMLSCRNQTLILKTKSMLVILLVAWFQKVTHMLQTTSTKSLHALQYRREHPKNGYRSLSLSKQKQRKHGNAK